MGPTNSDPSAPVEHVGPTLPLGSPRAVQSTLRWSRGSEERHVCLPKRASYPTGPTKSDANVSVEQLSRTN